MKFVKFLSLFLFGALFMTGCLESEPLQSEVDETAVVNYLNAKGLPFTRDDYGYFYHTENGGTGSELVDSSIVKMVLKAKDLGGNSMGDTTVSKAISGVSYALRLALPKIKTGGEINVYVPAYLNGGTAMDLNAKVEYKYANQAEADDTIINEYFNKLRLSNDTSVNGIVKDERGFYYKINKLGTGNRPTVDSVVTVKYVGKFLNGVVFDKTSGSYTYTNALTGLIKGWQYGVPLLNEGSSATFYFPSAMCYGVKGTASIPASTVLIFDITLTEVLVKK